MSHFPVASKSSYDTIVIIFTNSATYESKAASRYPLSKHENHVEHVFQMFLSFQWHKNRRLFNLLQPPPVIETKPYFKKLDFSF